jgi:ATP-dependent exoDNAse (exonuclease V) beta subunit
MRKGPNWATSKYYGKTDEEIMKEWSDNGKQASSAGTAMHLAIEQFLHGSQEVIDPEVLKTKEWTYFKNFWRNCGDDLIPYRSEWEVYSEPHKLAGSIDMVYYRPSDKKYVIYDWKRSKEIKTENRFENGYPPLDHLPNCNYWHYTLQLNVYKWMLETYYGIEIGDLYIVIIHPDNKNYIRMRLNMLPDEVKSMMECRKRSVDSNSDQIVILPVEHGS